MDGFSRSTNLIFNSQVFYARLALCGSTGPFITLCFQQSSNDYYYEEYCTYIHVYIYIYNVTTATNPMIGLEQKPC